MTYYAGLPRQKKKGPGIPQSLLETEPQKSKFEITSKEIKLENMKNAPKNKTEKLDNIRYFKLRASHKHSNILQMNSILGPHLRLF